MGLLFGELMRGLFSTVGSLLVGLSVVGLILIGRSSFSFIEACRRALVLAKALSLRLGAVGERVAAAWKQARALRRSEREAERREPRIEPADPDAAILAELAADDDTDWIPIERTGVPPLALSQALRAGSASNPALVAALAETPAPPALAPNEAKPRTRAEKKDAKARRQARREGGRQARAKATPSPSEGDAKPVAKDDAEARRQGDTKAQPKRDANAATKASRPRARSPSPEPS